MREVIGDTGPAVLLLPGGAEAVDGFFPGLVEGLRSDPGARVVLIDRAGTEGSDTEGALADAGHDLHGALLDLGVGPVTVVGQSLGGAVALLLARDHPEDVAGLVLLDPTPVNDAALSAKVEKQATSLIRFAKLPLAGGLVRALLRLQTKRVGKHHRDRADVQAALATMNRLDLNRLGRAVNGLGDLAAGFDMARVPRVPTVIVTADRKPGDPARLAHERLAQALGARLVSWPQSDHAVHLTHPDEVLEVVRDVLREVSENST